MTDQEIENAIEGVRCKGQNLNADLNNLSKCSMGTAKLYKEVEKLKKNLK